MRLPVRMPVVRKVYALPRTAQVHWDGPLPSVRVYMSARVTLLGWLRYHLWAWWYSARGLVMWR